MQREITQIGPLLILKHINNKGMQLLWNFQGIIEKSFSTYHFFVFYKVEKNQARQFVQNYYEKIGNGDLLGLLDRKRLEKNQNIQWMQKTSFDAQHSNFEINEENILKSSENVDQIIQKSLLQVLKRKGLVFVNFLFVQQCQKQKAKLIQKTRLKIKQLRTKLGKCDHFVLNLFEMQKYKVFENSIENRINCSEGLNYFQIASNKSPKSKFLSAFENQLQTQPQLYPQEALFLNLYKNRNRQLSDFLRFFKNYSSIICLKSLTIKIYPPGGFLFASCSNSIWKISDVDGSLNKKYFGVPACKFTEYLCIIYKQKLSLEFEMEINYEFYDQTKIKSSRKFFMDAMNKLANKTVVSSSLGQYVSTRCARNMQLGTDLREETSYVSIFEAEFRKFQE